MNQKKFHELVHVEGKFIDAARPEQPVYVECEYMSE
jgi:hypothetical protein